MLENAGVSLRSLSLNTESLKIKYCNDWNVGTGHGTMLLDGVSWNFKWLVWIHLKLFSEITWCIGTPFLEFQMISWIHLKLFSEITWCIGTSFLEFQMISWIHLKLFSAITWCIGTPFVVVCACFYVYDFVSFNSVGCQSCSTW
jgi:hypothetical protein